MEKLIDDAGSAGEEMGLVWVDKEKGTFEMPFATIVVVMQRKT